MCGFLFHLLFPPNPPHHYWCYFSFSFKISMSSFHLHCSPISIDCRYFVSPLKMLSRDLLASLFLWRGSLMFFRCSIPVTLRLCVRFPLSLIFHSPCAQRWFPLCVHCLVLLLLIGVGKFFTTALKCFLCTFFPSFSLGFQTYYLHSVF